MKKVDQKLDEILEQCLADIKSGRATREDCLLRYKEHAAELAPLLRAAVSLYKLPAPRPSERRVLAGRQRILQELSAADRAPWWIGLRRALTVPTLAFSAALTFVLVTALGAGTAFMAYRDSLQTQPPGYPNPATVPPVTTLPTAQPKIAFSGIGVSNSQVPYEMASAPDGTLWFAQTDARRVGSVDADGKIKDWPIASDQGRAAGVTVDRAGKVWFTVSSSQSIVALDPQTNQITTLKIGTSDGTLGRITAGEDGRIWFIAAGGSRIYALDPKTEKFTSYEVEEAQYLEWADDALWFSGKAGVLGRITADGVVEQIEAPGEPAAMVWDGESLWYAGGTLIGRLETASNVVDAYAVTTTVDRIATDGLANIWFGSQGGTELGVLQAESGQIGTRSLDTVVKTLYSLAVGDSRVWMSGGDDGFIYALSISDSVSLHPERLLAALVLPVLDGLR